MLPSLDTATDKPAGNAVPALQLVSEPPPVLVNRNGDMAVFSVYCTEVLDSNGGFSGGAEL